MLDINTWSTIVFLALTLPQAIRFYQLPLEAIVKLQNFFRKRKSKPIDDEDPLGRHVQAQLSQMRRQRGIAGLSSISTLLMLSNILVVAFLILNDPPAERGRLASRAMHMGANAIVLPSYVWRHRLTVRQIDLIYSTLMLLFVLSIIEFWDANPSLFLVWRALGRLYLGTWVLNLRLVVFWNSVFSIVTIVAFGTSQGIVGDPMTNITVELFVGVTILLYLRDQERSAAAVCRYAVEQRVSNSERSATHTLLNALCDAVVSLTEDLCLAEHSPKLSGLLLHHRTCASLKGREMQGFMFSNQDKEQFKSFISRPGQLEECVAEILHTTMRDSLGNPVKVSLVHAKFLDLDDGVGHLVGICENDGLLKNAVIPDPGDSADLEPPADLPKIVEGAGQLELDTSEDELSSRAQRRQANRSLGLATITFDAVSMDKAEQSTAHAALCGSCPTTMSFFEQVVEQDRFLRWLQVATQAILYDESEQPISLHSMTMRPPRLAHANLELQAECAVMLLPGRSRQQNAEDGHAGNEVVIDVEPDTGVSDMSSQAANTVIAHLTFSHMKVLVIDRNARALRVQAL